MPVTTTANSERDILFSISSGNTGRAPSLKLEMHLWDSRAAQAQIAMSTAARAHSGYWNEVIMPSIIDPPFFVYK